jgi:long-chain acyl-CoA synthetase
MEKRHTLIHHFLEHSAKKFPDKIALIHENVRVTYAQINAKANRLAQWLINQGVEPGDRVALILENCLEYVISYYGGLKAGAVVAPLSTDIKPDGLGYLIGELEAKAIISSAKFEKILQESDLPQFPLQALVLKSPKLKWPGQSLAVLSWDDLIRDENSPNPDLAIEGTALGSIIYTSGSTGKPKGVMLSHRNIAANVHSICQYLHLTQEDIQMAVLPFFYVMGKSLLNTHFAVGGMVVINNKFTYPAAVLKQMVEEQVTGFSGVPSTYAYLLHRSPLARYRDKLESLRYCSQAGGHMSRQIKEELRRVLPEHTQIYVMYGATEAGARLSYLDPDRFVAKMESIGKAIPGVTLRVINEKGEIGRAHV